MQRGDGSRVLTRFMAGGLLPNAIYIYIYTQTQLFEVSILERFWRGSGEVLERDLETRIIKKHKVFIGFSIESIKKQLVFLGFSCFWRALEPRIIKKPLVFIFICFSIESIKKPCVLLGFSCFWRAL